jgi:hypothetical protein
MLLNGNGAKAFSSRTRHPWLAHWSYGRCLDHSVPGRLHLPHRLACRAGDHSWQTAARASSAGVTVTALLAGRPPRSVTHRGSPAPLVQSSFIVPSFSSRGNRSHSWLRLRTRAEARCRQAPAFPTQGVWLGPRPPAEPVAALQHDDVTARAGELPGADQSRDARPRRRRRRGPA